MYLRVVTVIVCFIVINTHSQSFCDDYLKCMEKLEEKQRECLAVDQNTKHRSSDSCSRQKWEMKLELLGLHLRRAEMAKDCVGKTINDAKLSESTLDKTLNSTCSSLHEKFMFAPIATRKKRSNGTKKAKRDVKKVTKSHECRTATKQWHKQCSALAKCCPLAEECKQSSKEIMDQIHDGRRRLESLKQQCHKEK